MMQKSSDCHADLKVAVSTRDPRWSMGNELPRSILTKDFRFQFVYKMKMK